MTEAISETIQRQTRLQMSREVLAAEEAAWRLGFSAHEIPILVARKLLQSLGDSHPDAPHCFSAAAVENLRRNKKWRDKANRIAMQHWQYKNSELQNLTNRRNPAHSKT